MNDADNDPILRRAIDELRKVPSIDAGAVRRVIDAAAAARVTAADEPAAIGDDLAGRRLRLWAAIGVAAAAAVVGFLARGAWVPVRMVQPAPMSAAVPQSAGSNPALRNVSAGEPSAMPIPEQFVFEKGNAHRISVVGDFNKWNSSSAPMTRSSEGNLWSAMIPIVPGRHVYGFMVDDTLFVLDPRAQKTRDPDLGTEGSVRMVGRP